MATIKNTEYLEGVLEEVANLSKRKEKDHKSFSKIFLPEILFERLHLFWMRWGSGVG